ncbi:MAG: hypothetical protein ACREGA_02530 [Candidatus Saccharimonadales bacterium]
MFLALVQTSLVLAAGIASVVLVLGGTTYAAINLTTSSASNNQPTNPARRKH